MLKLKGGALLLKKEKSTVYDYPETKLRGFEMEPIRSVETDFSIIMSDLAETQEYDGAYCCTYEGFKNIYRFVRRNVRRNQTPCYLVLYTLIDRNNDVPPASLGDRAIRILKDAISSSLRCGDLYARYSYCQFVVILPGASEENGQKVAQRVVDCYNSYGTIPGIRLTYKLHPLAF